MIHKGDKIRIKAEWMDPGDDQFDWVACDDESKGRVTIMPTNMGLTFPPIQTVEVRMVEKCEGTTDPSFLRK